MKPHINRSLPVARFMRVSIGAPLLALVLAAGALAAREGEPAPAAKADAAPTRQQAEASSPDAPDKPTSLPEAKAAAPQRAFVPSEQVSPDQEVDFPADL
ncbi:MAG: hypothetical protein ACT4P0_02785 [Panacagrimonas sp.]